MAGEGDEEPALFGRLEEGWVAVPGLNESPSLAEDTLPP